MLPARAQDQAAGLIEQLGGREALERQLEAAEAARREAERRAAALADEVAVLRQVQQGQRAEAQLAAAQAARQQAEQRAQLLAEQADALQQQLAEAQVCLGVVGLGCSCTGVAPGGWSVLLASGTLQLPSGHPLTNSPMNNEQ